MELNKHEIKRILIIQLSRIGDVVFSLPTLSALKKMYPDSEIAWLVDDRCAEILVDNPLINDIIVFPRFEIKKMLQEKQYKDLLNTLSKFIKLLRKKKYDLTIDLHGLFKSGLMSLISRSRERVGSSSTNGMRELSWLVSKQINPVNETDHCVDRHLAVVKHLGGDVSEKRFVINTSEEDKVSVLNILKDNSISVNEKIVIIHAGGGWTSRRWLPERFAELSDKLVENDKFKTIFVGGQVGGRDENNLVENILLKTKNKTLSLAHKLTLKQYVALLKISTLFVGNEAGPMHLATAVGLPVVAIIGPTNPARTGPYGNKKIVVRKQVDCAPCRERECKTRICIDNITVQDVLEAIESCSTTL